MITSIVCICFAALVIYAVAFHNKPAPIKTGNLLPLLQEEFDPQNYKHIEYFLDMKEWARTNTEHYRNIPNFDDFRKKMGKWICADKMSKTEAHALKVGIEKVLTDRSRAAQIIAEDEKMIQERLEELRYAKRVEDNRRKAEIIFAEENTVKKD